MNRSLDRDHRRVEPMLADHAVGALTASRRKLVEAHLFVCDACRTTFEELRAAVAGMEFATGSSLRGRARVRVPHRAAVWGSLVAVAGAAVGALLILLRR